MIRSIAATMSTMNFGIAYAAGSAPSASVMTSDAPNAMKNHNIFVWKARSAPVSYCRNTLINIDKNSFGT